MHENIRDELNKIPKPYKLYKEDDFEKYYKIEYKRKILNEV